MVQISPKHALSFINELLEVLYVEDGEPCPNKDWGSEELEQIGALVEKYGLPNGGEEDERLTYESLLGHTVKLKSDWRIPGYTEIPADSIGRVELVNEKMATCVVRLLLQGCLIETEIDLVEIVDTPRR